MTFFILGLGVCVHTLLQLEPVPEPDVVLQEQGPVNLESSVCVCNRDRDI